MKMPKDFTLVFRWFLVLYIVEIVWEVHEIVVDIKVYLGFFLLSLYLGSALNCL